LDTTIVLNINNEASLGITDMIYKVHCKRGDIQDLDTKEVAQIRITIKKRNQDRVQPGPKFSLKPGTTPGTLLRNRVCNTL
jgi:hypothetical protein